ncbi:carboxypeptidase regulatory-like domain-containing protein [Chloroflexales bacterium ZM16-3]|nr:carboxypeptidase regulatory-like domain-containing protein [Chloroflexales bacterium ZM16-3]
MITQRKIEQIAIASLDDELCPSSEDLASFILGDLDGPAQLRVAAHVRGCPLCQQLAAICAPQPAPDSALRHLVASLTAPIAAVGLRGDDERDTLRRYVAADITVELTVPPPDGDSWQLVGQVLRSGMGLPFSAVQIQAGRRRPRTSRCDADGFFSFTGLRAGAYRVVVEHGQVRVEITSLILSHDD